MSNIEIISYMQAKYGSTPVPTSVVAKHFNVPRQYVHELCRRNGLTTKGRNPTRTNPCSICKKPVHVSNRYSPYGSHYACRLKAKVNAICTYCKEPIRGRYLRLKEKPGDRDYFCNVEHRSAAQRQRIWVPRERTLTKVG